MVCTAGASPLSLSPGPPLPFLQFGGDTYGINNELWSLRGVLEGGDGGAEAAPAPQWTLLQVCARVLRVLVAPGDVGQARGGGGLVLGQSSVCG